jgi:16S rRNA (uracil1498-N3)-methyltransferase
VRVQIAAAVPKGDRAQFLIEKLTELGIASFVPLRTERSVVQPGEGKIEKLERYVIQASKQCGRNILLQIDAPADWSVYCQRDGLPAKKMIPHPGAPERLPRNPGCDIAMAIGPEGGFTDSEIELAKSAGWQLVDLGPRMLRIETAAILLAAWACLAQ